MRFDLQQVFFWSLRLHLLTIALLTLIADGLSVYPDLDNRRQFLMERHLLLRSKGDLSRPVVERRSIEPEIIDELGEVMRPANVRVHSLFGRTIPVRADNSPYTAKIYRIGPNTHSFKARSFNDGNYSDAMKKILFRIN
ncbi:hypothetical protein M3Y98_01184900 [Aphelenchoides besseyi]|nr:hypothetical protein M3Y98_01184900 [Aphelenchoides besseyi]KAI6195240.1 hypothetical protein M3Y96_01209900 [Aphelenchoides besseyi]